MDHDKAARLWGNSPAGLFGYSHLLGNYTGCEAEYLRVPPARRGTDRGLTFRVVQTTPQLKSNLHRPTIRVSTEAAFRQLLRTAVGAVAPFAFLDARFDILTLRAFERMQFIAGLRVLDAGQHRFRPQF